jgi:hypothetical protein
MGQRLAEYIGVTANELPTLTLVIIDFNKIVFRLNKYDLEL